MANAVCNELVQQNMYHLLYAKKYLNENIIRDTFDETLDAAYRNFEQAFSELLAAEASRMEVVKK